MIRYRVAREKALNILTLYGIRTPPVNVSKIADKLGIKVVEFDFPPTISAVLRMHQGVTVIGVNKSHNSKRQRFSIAHELGHYLSGHENYTHDQGDLDRSKIYLSPAHQMELEANEFAAELLMPTPFVTKDVQEEKLDVQDLAKRYDVSEQAMWIQLFDLRLVADFNNRI